MDMFPFESFFATVGSVGVTAALAGLVGVEAPDDLMLCTEPDLCSADGGDVARVNIPSVSSSSDESVHSE